MSESDKKYTWVNKDLYPFRSDYISLDAGRMHYIEEGKGEVILFVHGTPTWSFLYRKFILHFREKYRCIAIDHIGFGLSDKPQVFPGKPEDHAENLSSFILKKDLRNITLVVHDFGGPIGLAAANRHPDRISKIVMFNTWLWETATNPDSIKVDRIVRSKLGRFMYLNLNFSPKVLLKKAFSDKRKLKKETHRHYLAPFPDRHSRRLLLKLAESLVGSSDWYGQQWKQLDKLTGKPWLIIWGRKDPYITSGYLAKWTERIPDASVIELDCGHFVQEEMPDSAINAFESFIQ